MSPEARLRDLRRRPGALGEGPTREKMAEFIRIMTFDKAFVTDEFVQERLALATDPDTMEGTRHALETMRSPDFAADGELWRHLEKPRARTLLTWGRDDKTMPGGLLRPEAHSQRRAPRLRRCGHWAQMERTDAFNRVVSDFLLAPVVVHLGQLIAARPRRLAVDRNVGVLGDPKGLEAALFGRPRQRARPD